MTVAPMREERLQSAEVDLRDAVREVDLSNGVGIVRIYTCSFFHDIAFCVFVFAVRKSCLRKRALSMTGQEGIWFGDTAMLARDTVSAELVEKNFGTQA